MSMNPASSAGIPGSSGAASSRMGLGDASFRTLPHEWAFGAFLLFVALRLIFSGHALSLYTLLFLALFAGGFGLSAWTGTHPSRLRWTIRLIWYPSIMGISFYALEAVIPLLQTVSADPRLAAWDLLLIGKPASDFFIPVQTPAFTDLMVAAYLLFFFYFMLGPAHYWLNDMRRFRASIVGLFTLYALGLTGYILLPAAGPLYYIPFPTPLPGGVFTDAMLAGVNAASNGFDVFPSIHVAVTLYLLGFDFRHFRRRFWFALIPCFALCMSTMYLRYHYFVDVVAGTLVAVIGLITAWLYERSRLAIEIDLAAESVAAVAADPARR